MLSKVFWLHVLDHATRTFAQSLVAVLSASGVGILNAPWPVAMSTAGMAAVLSVLTSIATSGTGDPDTPSLVKTPSDRK